MIHVTRSAFPAAVLPRLLAWMIAIFLLLPCGAAADETPQYMENEWNYVDGSMDVSNGIPENVTGRLAKIRSA